MLIDFHLTKEEWNKVNDKNPKGEYKETRFKTDSILKAADGIIKEIDDFSFESFEKKYFKDEGGKFVEARFQNYIKKLENEERISTAISYRCAMNSLKKFKPNMTFKEIVPDLLKKYETWMIGEGNSMTSIGIYLRSLRTLVNEALREDIINQQQYPFGKHKYTIPSGQNIKKALTIAEVQQIMNYQTVSGTSEDKARDFWVLSYLCNGANMKDICRWKFKNLHGDKIVFYRAKTERTSRNPKPISVMLTDKTKQIVNKWSNSSQSADNYIFPILEQNISAEREKKIIEQFIKTTNKYMKRIAKELGISQNLTTYVARHTFSTILKRNGVPISFISESLGHGDLRTTENYLGSFEDEQKKEYTKLLIPL